MKIDFSTRIDIPATDISIDHTTGVMLFGSCFSENIGLKLMRYKFQVDVNPFGILYNPFSISSAIRRIFSANSFSPSELIYHHELYHSLMHHGHFSAVDQQNCLHNISHRFENAVATIQQTDLFLVTFGSAYVYQLKETNHLLAEQLDIAPNKIIVLYSSQRSDNWIKPYLNKEIGDLPRMGWKKIAVMAPGFLIDNMETLYDLDIEARGLFLKDGGEDFTFIPCLNDSDLAVESIWKIISGV